MNARFEKFIIQTAESVDDSKTHLLFVMSVLIIINNFKFP